MFDDYKIKNNLYNTSVTSSKILLLTSSSAIPTYDADLVDFARTLGFLISFEDIVLLRFPNRKLFLDMGSFFSELFHFYYIHASSNSRKYGDLIHFNDMLNIKSFYNPNTKRFFKEPKFWGLRIEFAVISREYYSFEFASFIFFKFFSSLIYDINSIFNSIFNYNHLFDKTTVNLFYFFCYREQILSLIALLRWGLTSSRLNNPELVTLLQDFIHNLYFLANRLPVMPGIIKSQLLYSSFAEE